MEKKDISEWIIDYTIFFRDRGYVVASDFPERFFTTVSRMGIESDDAEVLEPVLQTMTVQSAEENTNFPVDFDDFVHNRKKRISREEAEKEIKQYNSLDNELERIRKRKNQLERQIEKYEKNLKKIEDSKCENGGLEEKKITLLLKEREPFEEDFNRLMLQVKDEKVREAMLYFTTLYKVNTNKIENAVKSLLRECVGEKNGYLMVNDPARQGCRTGLERNSFICCGISSRNH